jgi:hypothetical protein
LQFIVENLPKEKLNLQGDFTFPEIASQPASSTTISNESI